MVSNDKESLEKEEFINFIKKVDLDFPIPLSEKVDIEEYCDKLWNKAEIIFDIESRILRGVATGYTKNIDNGSAYISLVAVLPEYRSLGIGRQLVQKFVEICNNYAHVQSVNLYTHKTNKTAIKMYETLGFERYKMDNEIRTEDIHFIKYL